ncbi:MAG: gluconate 2-dehydrogenase subunit 3 family protein [Gemmatimonadetes bacterium]|nr:gluconate 2-dehydrogenase subunit 3 family protein [Gemmatimonadota bacterium]
MPEMTELDEAGWAGVERTVEHALAQRPPRVRRQVGLFLAILNNLPRLRYGRSFSALDAARRAAVIDALQHGPVLLLRRGVWGLRTLVLMGFYTLDETMTAIGYRAHVHGWGMHRPIQS